jgi:hypothetical protein
MSLAMRLANGLHAELALEATPAVEGQAVVAVGIGTQARDRLAQAVGVAFRDDDSGLTDRLRNGPRCSSR